MTPELDDSERTERGAAVSDWQTWWHNEGSGISPLDGKDREEHGQRLSIISWCTASQKATDEIERVRQERDDLAAQYAQVRADYTAWWKAWLDDHRSVDVAAWLRAYAKAMPDAHPDGPSEVQVVLDAVNKSVTASADEIDSLRSDLAKANAERDEMRRELRKAETEAAMLRVECGATASERDEARRERDEANANAKLYRDDRDRLAARIAELERAEKLAKMWAALAEYQPQADRDGHGESWRKMCEERKSAAAFAAAEAAYAAFATASYAAKAAYAACYAASNADAVAVAVFGADAITAIRRAKEAKP